MSLPGAPCAGSSILGEGGGVRPPSLVERLDSRTRVILALLFAVALVTGSDVTLLTVGLGLALILALLARLPVVRTLRRMLVLEGFMLVVLALLPFSIPGRVVAEVLGFAASAEGLTRAAQITLKANAITVAVFALLGTLEVVALGRALARLGAPERLVHLFLFTVRYLDVLDREYRRLRLAMRARAFRPATGPHCWCSIGYLFGMLMVRSLERAERIDAAMRCRGFTGRFPCLHEEAESGPGALDWGVGAASTAAVTLLLVMG
ncbi:ABC-type cobalt transport system, permease component CbiQ and related transporters [Candidatus Terasakiella magnetica]|nr:ABC-type cobalt transport system, permease component CbiQ and related transporters [Candidatus Terasakiella magnetica]